MSSETTDRRSWRGPRRHVAAVATLSAVLLGGVAPLASCSSGRPSDSDGTIGTNAPPPVCSSPALGCPCAEQGRIAECGTVKSQVGDYVTCSMGHTRCDGARWGSCNGDRIVVKSLPGRSLSSGGIGLSDVQLTCDNVCDPWDCHASGSDPTNDVDAAGLRATDAGVSILGVTNVVGDAASDGTGCRGLQCQVPQCGALGTTTITGTVYDPAGLNPLYNAYVYIPVDPSAALPAFTSGASCDTCAGAGSLAAVAVAQTGADGTFTLRDVPAGANIPIVVQMGKWRRKTTLANVTACTANAAPAANTRLPRNQTDGDGSAADIPKMALVSGSADPFECLLLKMGVDSAEFGSTTRNSTRRIHYYNSPDRPGKSIASSYGDVVSASTMWSSVANLSAYDVVLLPCEGREIDKGATATTNLIAYADLGGRVFTTHFGYAWMIYPAAWQPTASWLPIGHNMLATQDPLASTVDQTFPKGLAYAQWLRNVGASTVLGNLDVHEARQDLTTVGASAQQWMTATNTKNSNTSFVPHFTFNTPYGAAPASQCGRVVYSDFHVSADALAGSCTTSADCGFGQTCSPAVMGTCEAQTCTTNGDCSTGYSCSGASAGSCVMDGTCTKGSHCRSGSCSGGVCAPSACSSSGKCGSREKCSGRVKGSCSKGCTTDGDCDGEYCVAGTCRGCFTDNDCPSGTCTGGQRSSCSGTSTFPGSCKSGPLTAQEKALEFMLLDLTACVSPDSAPPPPPPAPVTTYPPVTFVQTFTSVCTSPQRVVWRKFDWQANIPSSASIDFALRTAATSVGLASATTVPLATATTSTALPNFDVGLIDTGSAGVFRTASPVVQSEKYLSVIITLNPTTGQKASPTLYQWKVEYDCVDAE